MVASVSEKTCDALRAAMIDHVTGAHVTGEPAARALDHVIQQLTLEGQGSGARVEQLLVVVKTCWHDLPAAIRRSPRAHPDVLLNRLVSGCIRAYYADARRRRGARRS
jgi:hypothetical protein